MEFSTGEAPVAAPCAAGFWRRSIAFIVDALVLGIIGALAGWALFDEFARMGGYGRALGFVVALAFFGVMNSALCGGQTLGKRLLGVRVVGNNGSLLSLPQSLLRYSVLGMPFFLNGAPFDTTALLSPMGYVLSLVIFGGMFSILYLYVFNRRGRRSLHDLVVGSSVVMALTPVTYGQAGAGLAGASGGGRCALGSSDGCACVHRTAGTERILQGPDAGL